MKKILMFGKNGLISYRIKQLMGDQVLALGSDEVDFKSNDQILNALEKLKPDLIINAAAYTKVDQAEDEVAIAHQINGFAVGTIANWVKKNNAFLIHFSTDYVFDGLQQSGYKPNDKTAPINAYGESKLLGETEILRSQAKAAVFRISWIYDQDRGQNFFKTMQKLMTERTEISVVNDQWGMPTEAKWVAEKIVNFIQKNEMKTGTFHLSPQGIMSWYDFAVQIKNQFNYKVDIKPVPSEQYKTKAKRPKYSKLIEG